MPLEPRKARAAWLWDMLQAAREAHLFTQGKTFDDYLRDPMLRRAVERVVEIIGEAAGKVDEAFCETNPQIPWRAIRSQRHRLAHEYDLIDDGKVWRVATIHVPELIRTLTPLVPEPPIHPDDMTPPA